MATPPLRDPALARRAAISSMILGGALVLRVSALTLNGLWYDELFTLNLASMPFAEFLRGTLRDTHPPLYPGLAFVWVHALGTSEWVVRLLPALIGTGAVALTLFAYRRPLGRRTAAATAALTALLPLHIYYSQEFRNYGLAFAAVVLVTGSLLKLIETPSRRGRWLFAMSCGFLAGTHYLGVFVIGVATLLGASSLRRSTGRWRPSVRLALAVAVCTAPFMAHMVYRRVHMSAFWPPPVSGTTIIETLVAPFGNPILAAAFGLLACAGVVGAFYRKSDRGNVCTLAILCTLPMVGVILTSLAFPEFSLLFPPRVAIILVPPFLALATLGIRDLLSPPGWTRASTGLIVLLLAGSAGSLWHSRYYSLSTKQANREGVSALARAAHMYPGLYAVSIDPPFELELGYTYYSRRFGLTVPIHSVGSDMALDDILRSAREVGDSYVAFLYVHMNVHPSVLASAYERLHVIADSTPITSGGGLSIFTVPTR